MAKAQILTPELNNIIKKIVKEHCQEDFYKRCHKIGIGPEAAEEGLEKAIRSGNSVVYQDMKDGTFVILSKSYKKVNLRTTNTNI